MAASPVLPTVISLMGPTAAGKTDVAIALHREMGAQLISVDSALVYRGMNIGSAKPSEEECRIAPHRLLDIRDPSEPYSAADFCVDAKRHISDIVAAGDTPLLVGGTMLYFKALLEGLSDMPAADASVRAAIEIFAERDGWPAVHEELARVDPISAAKIHPNHSQRVSRALEVFRVSGKPMSSHHQQQVGGLLSEYNWVQIALVPDNRAVLHERIALRFEKMIAQGLVEEVKRLHARDELHVDLPAIRAVGYRQVWEHLDGDYDFDTMREKVLAATRQLAKRQLTWLRSWPGAYPVNTLDKCGNNRPIEELVAEILKLCTKTVI